MAGVKGRSGRKRTPLSVVPKVEKVLEPFSAPEPPAWATDDAKGDWGIAVEAMRAAGVSGAVDPTTMALFCEQFTIWRKACAHVSANGLVMYRDNGNAMTNPAAALATAAHDRMEKILKQLRRSGPVASSVGTGQQSLENNRFALLKAALG